MSPDVTLATPDQRPAVVTTFVAAFRDDPAVRWFFADEDDFDTAAATFAGTLFDRRVTRDAVWTVDGGAAFAMWDPPGVVAAPYTGPGAHRLAAYDAAVHGAIPDTPHWYLGILACRPDMAGKGWGRAAMAAGLARAAADRLPAYLETSSPTNVGVYERAGWRVVARPSVPDLSVWVMRHG